jgi:hypothetical protein
LQQNGLLHPLQWTTSSTPTTLHDRQQYQGWMLTLSGSAHP